mmetsp:Transcript_40446/g.56180  ORF Transcript_40446/g.56180 Transcript_40446/m.56180 type:complete len:255 (+) Transcript_40446:54-818(+)
MSNVQKEEEYYTKKLSADRLQQCYAVANPRIQQFLDEEIQHVVSIAKRWREKEKEKGKKDGDDDEGPRVLVLGCGYGREVPPIARESSFVVGIDISPYNIALAKEIQQKEKDFPSNIEYQEMNALHLSFEDETFDIVVCIQNGISAFHIDQKSLIKESLRVLSSKRGGIALFSSYSEKIWDARLEWFYAQSSAGLLGEIDKEKTKNGLIVCKDGFTATTVGPDQFLSLCQGIEGIDVKTLTVDDSSVFCEISKK